MKITKFSSKAIATVTIRITCSIALFCIIAFLVFCILFFKGLIPIYPIIDKNRVDEFCGGDLWSDVINEFDNVKIDSISPLHSPSQYDEKEKYSVRLKIKEKDKDKWIEDSIAVSSYVSRYIADNPQCEINDFNEITVEIVYDTDANYVSFSNIYDMGKNKEKLDDCAYLVKIGYLVPVTKYCEVSHSVTGRSHIPQVCSYKTTAPGRAAIYGFVSAFLKWWIPVVISIAAFIVSLISLILKV